jgi:hypothetical protein
MQRETDAPRAPDAPVRERPSPLATDASFIASPAPLVPVDVPTAPPRGIARWLRTTFVPGGDLAERGAGHVRIGLTLEVLATLTMFAIAAVGTGPGNAIGIGGWIGGLVTQGVLVAALLSGSRFARGLLLFSGFCGLFGASAIAVMRMLMTRAPSSDEPILLFAACIAVSAAGSLLATVTPAARAWFRARRSAIVAKRKVKSLAEWRGS